MALTDERIATAAQSELPKTWEELAAYSFFGTPALTQRIEAVMRELFGAVLTSTEQDALDTVVVEYAAKRIALKLIGPGIDFWSKQPTAQVASGRPENKTWANRAADLKELRKQLLVDTAEMWVDVEPLLPVTRRRRVGSPPVPTVAQLDETGHITPNPDDVEPPYAPFRGSPDVGLR